MLPRLRLSLFTVLLAALLHVGLGALPAVADDNSGGDSSEDSSDSSHSEDDSSSNDGSSNDGAGTTSEDSSNDSGSGSEDGNLEGIESGHYEVEDHQSTRNAVGSSRALPLKDILAVFAADFGAQVVDVQLIRVQQFLLYQIKYVDTSGSVRLAYYYARSGLPVTLDSAQ